MRLKAIEIIKRENGFFWLSNGQKIRAIYPRNGYAVMCFLDHSQIDNDFEANVWIPSAKNLQDIKSALEIILNILNSSG